MAALHRDRDGRSCATSGQTFATKPIRIVTGNVGGSADFVARLVAQGISRWASR
jgi:tripartite-type tricarboxylate transporter receptor subunit TctC